MTNAPTNNTKHELMSPVASMDAQLQLLKRSKEYEVLPEKTKQSLIRLEEKLHLLEIRLRAFLQEL